MIRTWNIGTYNTHAICVLTFSIKTVPRSIAILQLIAENVKS